jgi:hypothetical protein
VDKEADGVKEALHSTIRYSPYVLLATIVLLILVFVLVPFFLSGFYQLSPNEVVEAAKKSDFSWYPLYGEKGLKSDQFVWGFLIVCFSPCVATLLFIVTFFEFSSAWFKLGIGGKLWRLGLLALVGLTGLVTYAYFDHLMNWLLYDLD